MEAEMILALAALAHETQPVIKKGVDLIESLFGEPLKVAGGMLADQFYAWKVTRAVKLGADCGDKMSKAGVKPKALPPGFLSPFIEAAVNAPPEMDDMWSNLLGSAVSDDAYQHPYFRQTLGAMNADEGRLLLGLNRVGGIPIFHMPRNSGSWFSVDQFRLAKPDLAQFYYHTLLRLDTLNPSMPAEPSMQPQDFAPNIMAELLEMAKNKDWEGSYQATLVLSKRGKMLADACGKIVISSHQSGQRSSPSKP